MQYLAPLLACLTLFLNATAQNNPARMGLPKIDLNNVSIKNTSKVMSMAPVDLSKTLGIKIEPGVYDEQGNLMNKDSAAALAFTAGYTYTYKQLHNDGRYYKILRKVSPVFRAKMDSISISMLSSREPMLRKGELLDLKPFGNQISASKTLGKALVLIFWYPGCFTRADGFKETNAVIDEYTGKKPFEVYAVTSYSYHASAEAMKVNPISGSQKIFDAKNIVSAYSPNGSFLLIVTDKDHRITYTATANASITPRFLAELLKAL